MYSIKTAKDITFQGKAGETILESALKSDFVLEYSCERGLCGVCKAKLISGRAQPLIETPALPKNELEQGYILTCCYEPRSDLIIDAEELSFLKCIERKTLRCKIDDLDFRTSTNLVVKLRLPPSANFQFVSGQFINLKRNGISRSYSLASTSDGINSLELHIKKVEGGVFSNYWFNDAKVNDLLTLDGPVGTFCYRDTKAKQILFLATGTGIAPVKSIISILKERPEVQSKEIQVIWGGRSIEDFYLDDREIGLKTIRVLSRNQPSGWAGSVGYVQDVALSLIGDFKNSVVYACGSDEMIHSARKLLCENGLDPKEFYSDAFVSSS